MTLDRADGGAPDADASAGSDDSPAGSGDVDTDAGASTSDLEADADPGAVAAEHPVLLFDGVCNLCTGSVRFVIERDPAGLFRFAPLQSPVADELLADHDVDPDELGTVVLLDGGEAYTKSSAALRVARELTGPWSLLWAFRTVPKPLRDAVYDLIAATRYDVFGREDSCMVPTPEVRDRFLATSDAG